MRRLILASVVALAPGLAFAQSASDNSNPPPPPPGAEGMGPGPVGGPMMGPPGGKGHRHMMGPEQMLMDFYAANTTHDGHLTLAQAKAADFRPVVDHFSAIDVKKRGYVTFYDIQAWHLDDMAKHLEAQATALRAMDK
ncbi:hypothetical protein [Acidocella sp.]|uniref:hypothetical protein n=1 Tax=Acidocella sp. TaxID=50710 RepID=UPI003CFC60AC